MELENKGVPLTNNNSIKAIPNNSIESSSKKPQTKPFIKPYDKNTIHLIKPESSKSTDKSSNNTSPSNNTPSSTNTPEP
jgi:hypothetical protein